MIKVLLDQGLSPQTAKILRDHGCDANHVFEVGLANAPDPRILAFAKDHGYICVTLDQDFHSHLASLQAIGPSVVLIRQEGIKAPQQASVILTVVHACKEALLEGSAISVDSRSTRIRLLPLR